jgi:predicted nucleic acid-binding protein
VSLYLDTSCFLKLLRVEPETQEVSRVVDGEAEVILSHFVLLEVELQITAARLAGSLSLVETRRAKEVVVATVSQAPFILRTVSAEIDIFAIARKQNAAGVYCRTLDRLHLAVMEALGVDRLLTNDNQQAAAARALGFDVVMPR